MERACNQFALPVNECVNYFLPDTQKEEIANTKENELYEVTTSCDPHIEMEENNSYEAPTSTIKMAEHDTQMKKRSTEMKEDIVYEVPPQ